MGANVCAEGVFFFWSEQRLRFVGTSSPDELGGRALLSRQLLATAEPDAAARDFRRRRHSAEAARRANARLLSLALDHESLQSHEAARALWEELDREYSLYAEQGQEDLLALATSLGLEPAAELAGEVRAGITAELLPGLHAAFAQMTGDARHAAFHQQRIGALTPAEGSPLSVLLVALEAGKLLAARHERERGDPREALRLYSEYRGASGRDAGRLAAELGRWLDDWSGVPYDRYALVNALVDEWPFDFRPIRALGREHLRRGTELAKQQAFADAAMELARALALNPTDGELVEVIRKLEEAQQSLASELQKMQSSGLQLNSRGLAALRAMRDTTSPSEYLNGPEAQALRNRSFETLLRQLATRLGLDPTSAEHCTAAVTLCETCAAMPEGIDANAGITALLALHAEAACADLESLRWLVEHRPNSWLAAAAQLPEPPLASVASRELDSVRGLREQLAARTPSKRAARWRLSWLHWTWTGRDLGYKLAAAAGVLALLGATGLGALRSQEAASRERAYSALREAAHRDDPAGVLDAASQFLTHTEPGFVDYRTAEVTTSYERELVRQLLSANFRADGAAQQELLGRARALQHWLEQDRTQRGTP